MLEILDIGSADLGETKMPWAEMEDIHVTGFDDPVFLGDGELHFLHRTGWPGCSSLLEPNPAVIERFVGHSAIDPGGNFTVMSKRRVKTAKLDSLNVPDPDWIKLDVQGAELMIMKHGEATLAKASVIHCEVAFLQLYVGQPLFCHVMGWLAQRGWFMHTFWDMKTVSYRPMNMVDGGAQLFDADAVFLNSKKMGPKMARILAEGYGSVDLAYKILLETQPAAAAALKAKLTENV